MKVVQPSAKREGFATVPGVSWSDVGALQNIRNFICQIICNAKKSHFPVTTASTYLMHEIGISTFNLLSLARLATLSFYSIK